MFYKNYKPIRVSLPWIIVYPKLKEVSYIAWQKKYPTLKTTCHIKPKFILWTPRQLTSYNQTWRNQTKKFLLEKIFSTQRKNFLYLPPSPLPPPKEKKKSNEKTIFCNCPKKSFPNKKFSKALHFSCVLDMAMLFSISEIISKYLWSIFIFPFFYNIFSIRN